MATLVRSRVLPAVRFPSEVLARPGARAFSPKAGALSTPGVQRCRRPAPPRAPIAGAGPAGNQEARTEPETPACRAHGPRLAIGAIVRNEGPYLLEWIAFHRVLGVDRFFIADNGSTDDGGGAARRARRGRASCGHLPFPDRPGRRPQLPAYAAILRRHGAEADWIAFIDADEFLRARRRPAPARCRALLAAARRRPGGRRGRGQLGALRLVRASSRPGRGPVIERFDRPGRAERSAQPPLQVDPAHRGRRRRPASNPHAFRLRARRTAPCMPTAARSRPHAQRHQRPEPGGGLGAAPAQPLRGEVARGVPDPQAAARPGHHRRGGATRASSRRTTATRSLDPARPRAPSPPRGEEARRLARRLGLPAAAGGTRARGAPC